MVEFVKYIRDGSKIDLVDCSLRLKKVKMEDKEEYICDVQTEKKPFTYHRALAVCGLFQYLITAGVLFSDVFSDVFAITGNTLFLLLYIGMQLLYCFMNAIFGGWGHMDYWCFTYMDIINWMLLSLLVVGYSTFSLRMFVITLVPTLVVDVLFHLQQYNKKFWELAHMQTELPTIDLQLCVPNGSELGPEFVSGVLAGEVKAGC
ncbi:uncharacterized protein LOC134438691 [Engraulis encrasicolus]|uniref:uncharacterized protein LOC134438691 n=1 Tax=Engraulis encrasicolus TaxID=184585 RepID=UPI002FD180F5